MEVVLYKQHIITTCYNFSFRAYKYKIITVYDALSIPVKEVETTALL